MEVGDDSLLVATNSNVVNVLVKGKIGKLITEGFRCPLVNQFCRNDDGKIYLSSDDGLFVLEKKKVSELDISLLPKRTAPYLSNISCTGNYLVISINEMADNRGLYLYDIKNNRICDALDQSVYLLGKDESNFTWIFCSNKLFVLDNNALAKGKLLLTEPAGAYRQSKNYSTTNVAYDKNCIWFLYRNQDYRNIEIHRIDDNGSVLRIPLPQQATSSAIKNIFVDKENTIWLCNDGEGVFKITNSPLRIFQNPLSEITKSQVDNIFFSGNSTWFRTNTDKLLRRSPKGLQEFRSNLAQSPEIFYQNGQRLLAHDSRNIYQTKLTDQTKIHFDKIITLPDSDFWTNKIIIDNYGNIIAAQNRSLSVWKNNQQVFQIPVGKNDAVEEIFLNKNNLLWVVTRFNGIDIFSIHPRELSKYLQLAFHFSTEQIVGSPRSFVIDKNEIIWIGTRSHGLVGYKQENNRLHQLYYFDISKGLTDNFVTSLACDSANNIIVGTQTGLDRILFDPGREYRIENLSKSENFFALIKQTWADDKQAYAITYSGVLLEVSPVVRNNSSFTPQLLLEDMRVNAASMSQEQKRFSYTENNIGFLVASPTFIDEKQVVYSYLLEGSGNKQWSDTTPANAVINLTNLAAGKYLLKVKAFFPSTSYSPAELSHQFEINPPWWQTWWFRSAGTLLIIGLLIIGFRFYYRRKLEKQMAEVEKQQAIEKERTRIATDMHDDLGAGLSRIKFLSETIGIKKQQQQPIEEDINKIREYSHEMIDKMGEIVWALNEKNDSLSDLLSYTRSYAMEYLLQNGIECKTEMPDSFPSVFVSGEFRRNVFLTVKEALHNVVKHSQATEVKLSIVINHHLSIKLKDNGTGFNKNDIRLFSNGLTNMESRVKEMGGKIEVINKQGTLVNLEIPLTV